MGVIATGSIFKTLTFDGKSSAEFNVYITGEGVFNAPERAVEMISIPGRNGAFALDNGRFENIEVTYNCGIAGDSDTDFAEAVSAFRNWLCSRNGYVRLTDDYNAGEYRMAVYKSGLEVTAERLIAGEFPIVFECKPQRFLTSGEDKITVGEWGETTTETGDIVEIENPDGILSVKSLTADINAEQDLNGYESPWVHDDNEQTPYLFRPSNTVAEVGNSIFDTLVGGTLAVNQLVNITGGTKTDRGITSTIDTDTGIITLSGTSTSTYTGCFNTFSGIQGHKYVRVYKILTNPNNVTLYPHAFNISWAPTREMCSADSTRVTSCGVSGFSAGTDLTGITMKVGIIDLTQFFCGSTIADYVYNLEQSTAGSGVAWLKQYYPSIFNSYQPYNAGTLESVEASAHVMTGKNQIDVADGSITTTVSNLVSVTLKAGAYTYSGYLSRNDGGLSRLTVYENGSMLTNSGNASGTTPMRVSVSFTLTTDTTISLGVQFLSSYDTINYSKLQLEYGTTATDYEPYTQTSYPLDSDLVLRGIPKLNNGVPYYDGDEYKSDGSVTRKYGVVDLGTLTWNTQANNNYTNFYSSGISSLIQYNASTPNIICAVYKSEANNTASPTDDNYIWINANKQIRIKDTSKATLTNAQFQSAMSGVYLIYELATPTTETADPYTNPQVVYADGTEEYVTNNVVPVGHITDHANICPITGHDTVNVVVSPTTTGGTTYSTALGSTVYGGTLDIVSGELTLTHVLWTGNTATMNNNEDYPGWRQCGIAALVGYGINTPYPNMPTNVGKGTGINTLNTNDTLFLPTNYYGKTQSEWISLAQDVQVLVELATPTTTTLTAQQVELLLGTNNIWADTGNVEVEFGQNPNILVNPTLFESRPMLEVTGSGAVNLGDDTIQINNDPIGDVVIFEQQTKNTASAWPVYIETQYANADDPIIVTECQYTVNWTLSRGLISDITYTTTGDGHAAIYDVGAGMKPAVWLEGVEFAFGTASTITTTATFTIVTTYYGTLTADITLSLAYDGASQLILSHTATRPTQFSSASPRKTIGDVILRSSQIALGNPIYIDLNIGEAYKIENDVPVSVNNGVVIPAELPTLAPGANMITCDDTITQLDIVPRWWKI